MKKGQVSSSQSERHDEKSILNLYQQIFLELFVSFDEETW